MALQDITSPFVWGAGGARKTPEQIARDREIAAALLKEGVDFSPIASPLQGLARVANAAAGAYGDYRANQAETANAETNRDLVSRALASFGPQQFPAAPGASEIAPTAAAASSETPTASPVAYSPLEDGAIWLSYANQGATRNQPLSGKLESALGSFLPEMGVTMKVFSGGQDATGPHRTGSHRHDHGNAADVFFYKDGRQLSWANPDDLPIFEDIVRRGKAAGITGFGAGDGYMRPGSMHIGFGSPAVWGAGGRGSNAPDWLRQAFNSPAGSAPAVAAVNALAEGQPTQVASLDQSIGLPQTAPVPEAAPPLPEPRPIQDMPIAGIPAGQQVAQALTGPDLSRIPVTAGGNAGVYQPGQAGGINPAIIEALSSPYADDQTKKIAGLLLGQQMEAQQQASDPLRQLQIEKMQRDLNAGPQIPDSVQALDLRAQRAGLVPGTPAYNEFMITGGSKGQTINVGGNNDIGTIPPGMMVTRDAQDNVTGMVPIPGGPAEKAANDAAAASNAADENRATSSDIITGAASKIRDLSKEPGTTGLVGAGASYLPNSPAAELYRQVDVLKSNAKIENLQAMRRASPTGGALGAVSDKENEMLAAKAGALDPKSPYFQQQLDDYERTLLRIVHGKDAGDAIFEQTRKGDEAGKSIPQGAIDMLRGDPSLAILFDAKYGQGAAARVLGGQ